MCGPWALPLALIVAGSGAKYFGEKQATHAQSGAFSAEQQRQKVLTDQQQGAFEDSLARVKTLADPQGQASAAAARETSLAGAIAPQSPQASYLPGSSSAAPVVQVASDKAAADSHATSLNLAHTLAALGGTNDAMQTANTAIGRNSGTIGQIASFKQGSAGVLDSEMRAAAHKGQFLRGVGSLAQQIGAAWLGAQGAAALGPGAGLAPHAGDAMVANMGGNAMGSFSLPSLVKTPTLAGGLF